MNRNNYIQYSLNHSENKTITPIDATKHAYFKDNKSTIQNNSQIWKLLFQLELVINHKQHLLSVVNKLLRIYCKLFNKNARRIELNIFNDVILTKQYHMFIKLSAICLMYIKFLLYEFEYENALKLSVKHLVFDINDILLVLLNQTLYIEDDNCSFDNGY